MRGEEELRQITADDTIPVAILRDFALQTLRHDAIYDALLERMAFHADRGQLDSVGLAAALPLQIGDVLDALTNEDWRAVAELLVENFEEARAGSEAR